MRAAVIIDEPPPEATNKGPKRKFSVVMNCIVYNKENLLPICFQEKVVVKAEMMERSCPKAEVKARQAAHVARDERTRSPENHAKKRGPRGNPERKKVSVCLLFSNQFTFITNMYGPYGQEDI